MIIGLGKIGAGYAADPKMALFYPYATHAQVLSAHPLFSWDAVVDTSDSILENARKNWKVPFTVKRLEDLPADVAFDVAVIATPPDSRLALLDRLPAVKGLLVEKPLGSTLQDSERFLARCAERNIPVQVNYWRRADETFRNLASGGLGALVGPVQAVFGVYGNGLLNNGSHIIDFIRMLCGSVEAVTVAGGIRGFPGSPAPGDINVPFTLRLASGIVAQVQPVRVEHYRENGLDIWGGLGRLSVLVSGLGIMHYPRKENRAMEQEHEIASDEPSMLPTTIGHALYRMYDNLADAINSGAPLWSPGDSALRTARVTDAILRSAQQNGALIEVDG